MVMEERKLYRLPVNENERSKIKIIPVHEMMLRMIEQMDSAANEGAQGKGFESEKIIELSLRRKAKSKIDRESENML
jgi:hypothetical protein